MSLSPGDPRLGWLGERVCLGLGTNEEDFRFLLHEKGADRPAKERFLCELDGALYALKQFFSESVHSGSAVFFFPVLEETVEEIQVQEAVTAAGAVPEGGEGGAGEGAPAPPTGGEAAEGGDAENNPQRANGEGEGAGAENPQTGAEGEEAPKPPAPAPAPAVEMRMVTKTIRSMKRR
jgi:hypothetical protein